MINNYLRVVRRRWFVIPAVLLVAVGVLVLTLNSHYTVTSRVVVPFPGDQNDQNFQGVAQSYAVARAVIHDAHLRGETPYQMLQNVTVSQEYGTNIYDITVKDTNKARATIICNDWVTDTISLYTKLNTAPASLAFADAQQQLVSAHQKIDVLQQEITQFEYAHPELVNVQTTTSQTGSQHSSSSSNTSGTASTSGQSSSTGANNSSTVPATGGSSGSTTGSSTGGTSSHGTTSISNSASGNSSTSSNTTTTQATNNTPGKVSDAQTLADLRQQQQDAQVIYDQLASVLSSTQLANLQTSQKAYAQVLDPATVPPVNVPLLALFTGLLGILLGLALIFGWEYFDNSMHGASTLENVFGAAAVVQVAGRPGRNELRHVAPGTWALPAVTPGTAARPGHWPTVTALAVLANAAAAMRTDESATFEHVPSLADLNGNGRHVTATDSGIAPENEANGDLHN